MRKLSLLTLFLLAACAAHGHGDSRPGTQPAVAPAPGAAAQNDTLARIHALVGTPSCSEDSQCHSLAIGARPCGGPETYLAYSTVRTPEAELKALGTIYEAERRKANAGAGRVSDCRFLADPGAVCRAGTCVLRGPQAVAR